MNEEEVKDIVKDVWWHRFKMLLESLILAMQEFMDSLKPVNKYDDGH